MKHLSIIRNIVFKNLLITLVLFTSTMFSQGLKSSHHDFSGTSWNGDDYCKPCHTPHDATMNGANSPLWNHQLTSAVFEMYTSPTLDSMTGQPSGNSKLCLSCHDGIVAIDSYSGNTNGTVFTSFGNLSSDLKNHHPISITYDTALALTDGELHDPSTTLSGLGNTIEDDLLHNNKLECTSCHDVHIFRNTQGCVGCHNIHADGGVVTKTLSLWKSNDKSALCLTCHKK